MRATKRNTACSTAVPQMPDDYGQADYLSGHYAPRTAATSMTSSTAWAAGWASPTSTGWSRWYPIMRSNSRPASAGSRPTMPTPIRWTISASRRMSRRPPTRRRDRKPVRRRQGSESDRQLRRGLRRCSAFPLFDRAVDFSGYFSGLLPRDHRQAALRAARSDLPIRRQFRRRHHDADGTRQGGCSSRWRTSPIAPMNRMKKLTPQMQELRDAPRRRQGPPQSGDDGALQAREGEPGGRLPAAGGADSRLLRALSRCSTSPSRCAMRRSSAGSGTCSVPDPTSVLNLFGLLPYAVPNLGPLQHSQPRRLAARPGRHHVPAAEDEPAAARSGAGARSSCSCRSCSRS